MRSTPRTQQGGTILAMRRSVASRWKEFSGSGNLNKPVIMLKLVTYRRPEMPLSLAWQIRSYVRIQWPYLDAPIHSPWDQSQLTESPLHFMLVDGELLVSHASVNWRSIRLDGEAFSVFGLSTVFTFPAYRKGGHAGRVVQAASDHVRALPGDVAMLFCAPALRSFYEGCGWIGIDSARILFGDRDQPSLKSDNLVMMLFISERGMAARIKFEHERVYVGPNTW